LAQKQRFRFGMAIAVIAVTLVGHWAKVKKES
jgi:hypothetical protein